MTSQQDVQREFRSAIGSFATGVTIATTTNSDGDPVGVTASSFNSVSLDPPLILWSLAKNSNSRPAFCDSGHFAIHILAASQEDLSNKFSRSSDNKFDGIDWSEGKLGSPILNEHAGLFQCRTRHQYEGGDHIILVGEVIDYDSRDEAPLLFHGGQYVERRPRPSGISTETVDLEHGRFTEDFLFYLISQAYFQTSDPLRKKLATKGSSLAEHMVLALLSMEGPMTKQGIKNWLKHTGISPTDEVLDGMLENKLIETVAAGFQNTDRGAERYVDVLAYMKSFETDLVANLAPAELADAKRVLRKIISLSQNDIPSNPPGDKTKATGKNPKHG